MICRLCPRQCGALRTETEGRGFCAMPALPVAARAMLHQWEEPCIRGSRGSGAVGFAVYLDQLERLEDGGAYDVDVLLLYGPGDSPAAVAGRAGELLAQGKSVRTEREAPQGLRWRELIRFGEGE